MPAKPLALATLILDVDQVSDLAVGETVTLLHPHLPSVGVSIGMAKGCPRNDSLADGYSDSELWHQPGGRVQLELDVLTSPALGGGLGFEVVKDLDSVQHSSFLRRHLLSLLRQAGRLLGIAQLRPRPRRCGGGSLRSQSGLMAARKGTVLATKAVEKQGKDGDLPPAWRRCFEYLCAQSRRSALLPTARCPDSTGT